MAKWADYCISAVRYDDDDAHIEELKVHEDKGDSIAKSSIWTRGEVVSSIENGNSFVTIYKNNAENWNNGEDVHVVEVNNVKYIRTDQNSTATDNLENLPEF